ncbi:MAG TPA: hypothetical protein VEA81_01265 [Burkholderiaceae bacterium]|nr:hypothetical protein [Burkholderiaceae bacterium]
MIKQLSVFAALAFATGLASAQDGFPPVTGPAAKAPAAVMQGNAPSRDTNTSSRFQAPDQRTSSVYVG